ncbi:MAG: DUF4355 domain-containing protein [Oscillospiraceae bacterium]|nr:DUF4355 domain-containing protein [Oscillospiraceae bacterium]
MSEFTPITTQEAFDSAIKDRIARAEKSTEARIKAEFQEQLNEVSTLKETVATLTSEKSAADAAAKETAEKISGLEAQLTEALTKNKGYELDALKLKVATEKGLPLEFRDRLNGDTEEALAADAENLSKLFKAQNYQGLPMANLEPGANDYPNTGKVNVDRALQKLTESLKGINE